MAFKDVFVVFVVCFFFYVKGCFTYWNFSNIINTFFPSSYFVKMLNGFFSFMKFNIPINFGFFIFYLYLYYNIIIINIII